MVSLEHRELKKKHTHTHRSSITRAHTIIKHISISPEIYKVDSPSGEIKIITSCTFRTGWVFPLNESVVNLAKPFGF